MSLSTPARRLRLAALISWLPATPAHAHRASSTQSTIVVSADRIGLVHGLGVASVLAALLPRGDVIWPLLAFNLGVELGQLAIVAVVLPVLPVLVRLMGAAAHRSWFLPASSAILAFLGALWIIERAFASELLGL